MKWFIFEDVENGCRRQVPQEVIDFTPAVLEDMPDFPSRVRLLRELFPGNLSLCEAFAVIRRAERLAKQS